MILKADKISFRYGSTEVLKDIDFKVNKGQITMILGPNGIGKTTLLKCLAGLASPFKGEIYLKDKILSGMNIREIARNIGYVAQKQDIARVTVFDSILLGRMPHKTLRTGKRDQKKVSSVMEKLNLTKLAMKYLDELSGGELQKVAVARALVQDTEIILMDEPTSSLDLNNQSQIMELIRRIAKEHNIAVVMTMHDLNTALRFGDRYLCLKDKEIFKKGDIKEISPETIYEVYGMPVEIVKHKGLSIVVPILDDLAA